MLRLTAFILFLVLATGSLAQLSSLAGDVQALSPRKQKWAALKVKVDSAVKVTNYCNYINLDLEACANSFLSDDSSKTFAGRFASVCNRIKSDLEPVSS